MTASKAYFKIVRQNLWLIIMYTLILCICSVMNMRSEINTTNFEATKANIVVFDNDHSELSNAFVKYLDERTNIKNFKDDDSLQDALYYGEIYFVLYIDAGYGEQISQGINAELRYKQTDQSASMLVETIVNRYAKVAYSFAPNPQSIIVEKTNEVVTKEAEVTIASSLDVNKLSDRGLYFNFLNYALLAGLVFAVSFATLGFKRTMVKKRMTVSATSYRTTNRQILLCNFMLGSILWLVYIGIGAILVGDMLFTTHGLIMIANSAIFMVFAMAFAFLLSNLFPSASVLLPIINVVSIGSSFICGVFIPAEWMPSFINSLAHILPSYYYVNSNYRLIEMENFSIETMQPIILNASILIASTIAIIILNNYISKRKQES